MQHITILPSCYCEILFRPDQCMEFNAVTECVCSGLSILQGICNMFDWVGPLTTVVLQ